jgi:hypothetical protein
MLRMSAGPAGPAAAAPMDAFAFASGSRPDAVGYTPTTLGNVLAVGTGLAASVTHLTLATRFLPISFGLALPSGLALGLIVCGAVTSAMASSARSSYAESGEGTRLMRPVFDERELGALGVKAAE